MIPSQFESWLEIEYVVLFTSQILLHKTRPSSCIKIRDGILKRDFGRAFETLKENQKLG